MIRQIVTWIIRRPDDPDPELFENLLSRKAFELVVRFGPDFWRGILVQDLLDAENPVELEMSPMPKGIPQESRHGPSKS